MTAGLEVATATEWLDTILNGDTTLTGLVPSGAWDTQPPQSEPYPVMVYQLMSGIDLAVVGAIRVWTDLVYLVKVIGDTADFASLNAAVARIDALLHRASGVATDGTVWACVREQVIRMPEDVSGRAFRHYGGIFRIYAS